jgi:uncharacterized protein (TIGR00255 family)
MAIFSMTGFGKGESSGQDFVVSVEIKSVNNRFRDIRCRIPYHLSRLEIELRKMIEERCRRGYFDLHLSVKKNRGASFSSEIDTERVSDFMKQMVSLAEKNKTSVSFSATEFLRDEFSLAGDDEHLNKVQACAREAMKQALVELEAFRNREGGKLAQIIRKYLGDLRRNLGIVEASVAGYETSTRERLTKKINESLAENKIDEPRFLQEIVYYMDRLDLSEEIERIKTHLSKVDSLLDGHEAEAGRQMEFLLQELGRETNTISSKSGHLAISEAAVAMKVALEKMREQSLNME